MNKYVKWGIVGAILIVFAIVGFFKLSPQVNEDLKAAPEKPSGKRSQVLNVKAVVMQEQSLTDQFYVSGSIIPDEEVDLSFETSGKITDIFFREGAHVGKGELLAKINDAPLQAELRKLESQLRLFQDRTFRQNALLEKEAVSREALQEAQTNLATLQAEIDQVKAKIAQTELRAPFSGVIGLRHVSLGAYASPTTTVAKLTKTTSLKIEFAVPERYAGILKAGNSLEFSVEGDIEKRKAKVYATDSYVNTDTRTYTVRALYDNRDGKLVPGRYVNVGLTTNEYEGAIAVPSQAIVSEMGIDKVFVCRGGAAMPVEITKGLRTDAYVQVLRGLNVGDTVITTGTMQLRTGQKVVIDNL